MTHKFPLTRDEFRAWLSKFDDDDKVGLGSRARYCPIAQALEDLLTIRASVTPDHVRNITEGLIYSMPFWARRFVNEFDAETCSGAHGTAVLARQILDEIPEEKEEEEAPE